MDIRKLRHALGLVEHLSFSRASIEVNLSQPALSRSIQALEAELGVPLFDRVSTGVELTPYGEVFAERARRILAETNELHRDIELVRRGEFGEISLGFGPTAAALLKGPLLAHFASTRPQLRLTLKGGTYEELLRLLLDERIDVFFGDAALLSYRHDLLVDSLPSWPSAFFCASTHPLAAKSSVQANEMLEYPLGCIKLSAWAMADLEAYFERSIEMAICFQTDNAHDLETMALRGQQVVFGSRPLFWQSLQAGQLREIILSPPLHRRARFGSVSLAGRTLAPSVQSAKVLAHDVFSGYAEQLAAMEPDTAR